MRKQIVGIFMFIILLLSSCAGTVDLKSRVSAPENKILPIQGKWEIGEYILKDNVKEDAVNTKCLQFSGDILMIGDNLWKKPGYRTRRVNTERFLLYKRRLLPSSFKIPSAEVDVITLTSSEVYIGEIIILSERKAIFFMQDDVFYINKVSEKIDMDLIKSVENKNSKISNTNEGENEKTTKSGVFIGLKSSNRNLDQNDYRTLWISADDGKLRPILQAKDIFFPRMKGFWKLQVNRIINDKLEEDILSAHDITNEGTDFNHSRFRTDGKGDYNGYIIREINYIGNNYVSIELARNLSMGNNKKTDSRLQILPVDNLQMERGIGVSDLVGLEGMTVMAGNRNDYIEELTSKGAEQFDVENWDENFGLERRTGHWMFYGRISYKKSGETMNSNYPISLIPPEELIFYDTLNVPWTSIKDRVPGAMDAFTSPREDIAVIVTKTKLYVYTIHDGELEKQPMAKLNLKENETVIMAEWASGSYVDNWEINFKRNNAVELENSK